MKKLLTGLCTAVLAACLLLVCAFSVLEALAGWDAFYGWRYSKSDLSERYGLPRETLDRVTALVQDLLAGRTGQFRLTAEAGGRETQLFGEQEEFHMKEVASLFRMFRFARVICAVIAVCALIVLPGRLRLFRNACAAGAGALIASGLACLVSFDLMFEVFHEVLFDNDLWLFSSESWLIRILDGDFFASFAVIWLSASTLILIACAGVSWRAMRRRAGGRA